MKVTILAAGSRGDVQPYIAIGQGVRELGHDCVIVTTLDHQALVTRYGLTVALVPVDVATELRRIETNRAVEGGGLIKSFRALTAIAKGCSRALAEVALDACRGADVIVTSFGTVIVADAIAKRLGVPLVQAYNVPLTPTSAFPGALFPRLDMGPWARQLSHRLTRGALWMTARSAANDACIEVLGASPAPRMPPGHNGLLPGRVLYGLSAAFDPRPIDWDADVEMTGCWFVDEAPDFAPPQELLTFLADGPPPVCIGFGSMSIEHPDAMRALVLEAAASAKARVVLLAGWGLGGGGQLSSDVLALEGAPHAWLYPRCSAVVHHGGAGTTMATVRAGIPAVVVPFHGDQPFWAQRVTRNGLGPAPIPRHKLSAAKLSTALQRALADAPMRERAAAVGRMVSAERGAQRAAVAILARCTA